MKPNNPVTINVSSTKGKHVQMKYLLETGDLEELKIQVIDSENANVQSEMIDFKKMMNSKRNLA